MSAATGDAGRARAAVDGLDGPGHGPAPGRPAGAALSSDAPPEALPIAIRRVGPVEVPLPAYQTPLSAGMDLHAALEGPRVLAPGARAAIPTGLALALPAGFEAQVRPRSGLALRHGIGMVNAPGTIDADYRGEIAVLLVNLGQEPFTVEPLARIAQLVVAPVTRVRWETVAELGATDRGTGGFGSTG